MSTHEPPTAPLDPVRFEILRRRLAAIADEAAITVIRVSGSQVVTEANDLNAVILNADGEVVISALYMLVHTCAMSGLVRYIVREYRDNPGIGPGDMFLTNDPYITGLHQPDAVLLAPIYDGDELIAWCGTTVHESDVGGPVPGSVAVGSTSIFDEAVPMAPVRIVQGGTIRRDLERNYLVRSRTPELNSLDLLGQVAANRLQTERVLALCRRYGTSTVTGAMAWLLASTERLLRGRLATLPDGVWHHRGFVEHDGVEDKVYAVDLVMTKSGDRLVLDFRDSSEQAPGLINCPCDLTRAFVLATVMPLLGYDQVPWAPAAFERVLELRTRPGTVVHATWPAGVSLGGTSTGHEVRTSINVCLADLLGRSATAQGQAMASCMSSAPGQTIAGTTDDGRSFTSMLLDAQVGGGGARSFADGVDTYGLMHSPGGSCANIEVNERNFPILYLWRAERPDSGGPGRYRGGVGGMHAFVPHGTDLPIQFTVWGHGVEHPAAAGVLGGEPATPNGFLILRGAARAVDASMLRRDPLDLPGEPYIPAPKERAVVGPGDVALTFCSGGGGYGDPLSRPLEAVRADVAAGLVSEAGAAADYGVVLRWDGDRVEVDEVGTDRLRVDRRQARRRGCLDPSGTVQAHTHDGSVAGVARCEEAAGYRWPLTAAMAASRRFAVIRRACAECGDQIDVRVECNSEARWAG